MIAVGKRFASLVLLVAASVLVVTGAAAASTNPRNRAKATAEAFVQGLLPGAPDGPRACDVKTQAGFFDKNRMYLAACASNDGTFQFFSMVNATNGGTVNPRSPYVDAQLSTLCNVQGGSAYATGVKGKYVNIFAGSGSNTTTAKDLSDLLAGQIKNLRGHQSVSLCQP
jgi:hypothetical protein